MNYTKKTIRAGKWILLGLAGATLLFLPQCANGATLTQQEQFENEIERMREPVVPQYVLTEVFFVVKVNVWTSTEDLTENFYKEKGNKYTMMYDTLGGYSNMRFRSIEGMKLEGNAADKTLYVCELNVVNPKTYYDPSWYTMGHEFGHCLFGQWHEPSLIKEAGDSHAK